MKKEGLLGGAIAVGVTLAVVIGYWWARSPETSFVKVGQAAPDLELPSLGGQGTKTRLSNYRGHPVLLVMFLSNCHTCDKEAWDIERLNREYLRRGLRVIGVALDKDASATADFVKSHQLTFIILQDIDGKAVGEAYRSWKMPEAYLIDAAGKVDAVYLGSVRWRSPEVRERIESVLPLAPERVK
jgi:peroxiredoxin